MKKLKKGVLLSLKFGDFRKIRQRFRGLQRSLGRGKIGL